MTYSDAGGAASLAEVHVLFSSSTSSVAACDVTWFRSDNTVRLADDADVCDGAYSYWQYANQSGSFLQQPMRLGFFPTPLPSSGNNLTLTLPIAFTASFAGAKNIYLEAVDTLGADSGLVSLGTWTVLTSAAPVLSIAKNHTGTFRPGQSGATYSVTVSNNATAGPTSGTVTVTETIPTGLTLVSMAGTGWTCSGTTCTRANSLGSGGSYPAITVTVNGMASGAPASVTNQVKVSGGGFGDGPGQRSHHHLGLQRLRHQPGFQHQCGGRPKGNQRGVGGSDGCQRFEPRWRRQRSRRADRD